MRVSNLNSPRSGEPVANQFMIENEDINYFQSYDTMIAEKQGLNLTISSDYNYSKTTSRYFNQWLKEYGYTDDDIAKLKKWLKTAKDGDTTKLEIGIAGLVTIINYAEEL